MDEILADLLGESYAAAFEGSGENERTATDRKGLAVRLNAIWRSLREPTTIFANWALNHLTVPFGTGISAS